MIPRIKKILYATDLSENSSYAFYYAVSAAKVFDAKITILHALEPPPVFAIGLQVGLTESVQEKEHKRVLERIENRLQEFCQKVETQIGSPCLSLVSKTLVQRGHPIEEILRVADQEECDILVLGSHGKGFLKQTFLGSVSHGVLQRSRKPVFIIPIPSDITGWNMKD
jgi:nucleotide-binding universal stress UspA family protein